MGQIIDCKYFDAGKCKHKKVKKKYFGMVFDGCVEVNLAHVTCNYKETLFDVIKTGKSSQIKLEDEMLNGYQPKATNPWPEPKYLNPGCEE